jgi:putative restriction endonuclease
MKFWVGITDNDWYGVVSRLPNIDEVNFWQPSEGKTFRALAPGSPFLFKLHSPLNFIVGGGYFAHWTRLPISLAWEAFKEKNGARSFQEMREHIVRYRKGDDSRSLEFQIGCILLEQPFFFERSDWIPTPDWPAGIQTGKSCEMAVEPGKSLWEKVQVALAARGKVAQPQPENGVPEYGELVQVRPRLGQGSFRVLVTDAYDRSCAISGEHTLPVLDAAHIKPFPQVGHRVSNGILLRSDIHRLFDHGYITITPDYHIEVSPQLKREFSNGRYYYPFDREPLNHVPARPDDRPAKDYLKWHNENVFKL